MSEWPSAEARAVLAALLRLGWRVKRVSGSHRTLAHDHLHRRKSDAIIP